MKVFVEFDKGDALDLSKPKCVIGIRYETENGPFVAAMPLTEGVYKAEDVLAGFEGLVASLKAGTFVKTPEPRMKRMERDFSKVLNMGFWQRLQFLATGKVPLLIKDPRS